MAENWMTKRNDVKISWLKLSIFLSLKSIRISSNFDAMLESSIRKWFLYLIWTTEGRSIPLQGITIKSIVWILIPRKSFRILLLAKDTLDSPNSWKLFWIYRPTFRFRSRVKYKNHTNVQNTRALLGSLYM